MAQIIKHRRGSLESVSSATKRAGELLVVTGSAGITATNGGSILFVGVDGSTVTPANKILQGTTVPNLTGGSYDTSIDGIPFYDTDDNKLYILNKGGNVEVKATANTGGTGIVSGSSQINLASVTGNSTSNVSEGTNLYYTDARVKTKLNAETVVSSSAQITYASISSIPAGIASGSSQITISSTTGFTDYSSSVATSISSSVAAGAPTFANIVGKPAGLVSGSSQIVYADISSIPAGIFSGSSQVDADSITNFDSNVKAKLDADGVISGSAGIVPLLPTGTISGSSQVNANSITNFDENVKDKLNAETVVSGSSQIVGILSALNTFSASEESKNSTLASYTSSLVAAFTASGGNVTFNGTTTIKGDLFVQGTTTQVDSTTINLADNVLQLNAAGTSDGGLIVRDATGGSTTSGSLLWDVTNDYWKAGALGAESKLLRQNGDSVVSGSSQIDITATTNYTTFSGSIATSISASVAGATWANISGKPSGLVSGSIQVLGGTNIISGSTDSNNIDFIQTGGSITANLKGGVVSGSTQIDITTTTGYTTFSSSISSSIAIIDGGTY